MEAVRGLEEEERSRAPGKGKTLFTSTPERPEKQDLYVASLGLKKHVPTRLSRDGLGGGPW